MDKSWMRLRNRLCEEYIDGVNSFMDAANKCKDENNCVRCPCRDCQNAFFEPLSVVQAHLYNFGISASYDKWIFHWKKSDFVDTGGLNEGGLHTNHKEQTYIEDEDANEVYDIIYDMLGAISTDGIFTDTISESNINSMLSNEEVNTETFAKLVEEASRKLFPGSKLSSLNFIIKLMHLKVLNQWSNKSMDMLLDLLKSAFSEGTNIPSSTYDITKMLKDYA
ncbi:hypothetical protein Dsin_020826 [Dipteronia sinensis]|uniref:Transposase-associated domain-containing protein n=1 Tax=Dipteronia sinensis TaxID=43782 RepID=A0AAE0AA71_9ROSI|nr:hypothetical protein Dsin_020826 [Dipteronia sinensis]